MSTYRAVVVDPNVEAKLVIQEVEAVAPAPGEAVIQVAAISPESGRGADVA